MLFSKIKNNYLKIVLLVFFVGSIISFFIPLILINFIPNNKAQADINFILGYMRFLVNDGHKAALEIAVHNWSIAATVFIGSFCSFGIFGILPLYSALFLIGAIFFSINPFSLTSLFIFLEALGMIFSVTFSTTLFYKRSKKAITLEKLLLGIVFSLALIFMIYFIASMLEIRCFVKFPQKTY